MKQMALAEAYVRSQLEAQSTGDGRADWHGREWREEHEEHEEARDQPSGVEQRCECYKAVMLTGEQHEG